jgi:hypothetical protein
MKKGLAQYALYLEARYYGDGQKWSKFVNHKFMPRRIGGWLDEARVALFYGSYEYLMKLEREQNRW